MKIFIHYKQAEEMDCGPTCLRMIAKHYGLNCDLLLLREMLRVNREGVSLLGISEAAVKIGFRTSGVKINLDKLIIMDMPCILHWQQNHFVVLYKIEQQHIFYLADPARGLIKYEKKEFVEFWRTSSNKEENLGIVLSIEPSQEFLLRTCLNRC